MIDENGIRSGYGYDFLRLAARYMNADYEYIGYESEKVTISEQPL